MRINGSLAVAAGYCEPVDTPIPGAVPGGSLPPHDLTVVEEAWLQVQATLVPACSEVTNHPLPVEIKNLTNGLITDAELAGWVDLDINNQTIEEWASRHAQGPFRQFLYPPGNQAIAFLEDGGTIASSNSACEYPRKIYAVAVDAANMAHITGGRVTTAGVGYAQAWAGPCTYRWKSADGQATDYPIAAGQELLELDVTQTEDATALGPYLGFIASVDPRADQVTGNILLASGI